MRVTLWVCVLVGVFVGGVLPSAEPVRQCRRSCLPANIVLTDDLDRVLQDLSDRSPSFKAQCDRLAAADNLRVVVRLDTSLPSFCRALTKIWRHGREIHAEVHVPPGRALVELVAHEFEHVIEQIEGLNMRALARKRGSGVREVERNLFESDRAQRAGRIVSNEVWRSMAAPSAD